MDWEENTIDELHQRLEAVQRCIDKILYPGSCGAVPEHNSCWPALSRGIAYLTGGVDRFGAPIIYLPHNPNLINCNSSDFQGVIKYLTAATKAPAADVGFVVLIDRRRDRWNSVAWALQNVALSFPGDLRMILLLRPTSIFHGALSSVAMRWQKDEYNYKVPIELLSSVDLLSTWIEKTDLLADLGGTSDYDHGSWLQKRQLVEDLAAELKKIVQECKTHSVELIDTHFSCNHASNEITGLQKSNSDCLLKKINALEQNGKDALKDKIWLDVTHRSDGMVNTNVNDVEHFCSLIQEVKDAFNTFRKTYISKKAEYLQLKSFEQDYKTASAHLNQLIKTLECQIREEIPNGTENIAGLSAESSDLELCIRACSAGQHLMDEHPYAIDCIKPKCEELKRLSSCFNNLLTEKLQSDELIRKTNEDIKEMNEWCSRGMKILSCQNLEEAKTPLGFKQTMQELVTFVSTYHWLGINKEHEVLTKDVTDRLPKPISKTLRDTISNVETVLGLFEKRKTSLTLLPPPPPPRNLQDGSRSPKDEEKSECVTVGKENVEILDCLPQRTQVPPANEDNTAVVRPILQNDISSDDNPKLRHVIKELIETEKKYVEELEEIVQGYGHAIDDATLCDILPAKLKENKKLLLGNLEDILNLHRDHLLPEILECGDNLTSISDMFITQKPNFMLYYEYCHNSQRSKILRKQIGENHPFFVECQQRLSHRLPLSAYLLKPIQRITKYQLLLQQMQKYKCDDATAAIDSAVEAMMDVLKQLNDSMHQISITGFMEEFSCLGKLLMQGSFQIQVEYKKSKVKDLARSKFNKPLQRHLFLYDNALLICKKTQLCEGNETRTESTKTGTRWNAKYSDKNNSYQFKQCIKTTQIALTEVVKGSPRKFKISSRCEDGEITATAPSVVIKQNWVESLQNCILRQRKTSSPAKIRPKKNRATEIPLKKTFPKDVRKIQRSKTTRESSLQPPIDNRMSNKEKPVKVSRKVVKRTKSIEEVTFGNIHGVDESPSKLKQSTSIRQEKPAEQVVESRFGQSFRGKKKGKGLKQ